jgi:hypothetical protein
LRGERGPAGPPGPDNSADLAALAQATKQNADQISAVIAQLEKLKARPMQAPPLLRLRSLDMTGSTVDEHVYEAVPGPDGRLQYMVTINPQTRVTLPQ